MCALNINEATTSVEKKKRKRSKNFTEMETGFLIDVVIRHIEIVENKKTDAVTWKEKEVVWNKIAEELQAIAGTTDRTSAILRSKYESIKQNIKSKLTKNKTEIFKTGGGSAELSVLTSYEQKLMGYIQINLHGIPCNFDSDYKISEFNYEQKLMGYIQINLHGIPCNFDSDYKISAVNINKDTEIITTGIVNIANDIPDTGLLIAQCDTREDGTSTVMIRNEDIIENIVIDTEQGETDVPQEWKKWNPHQLKEKKHNVLQPRRKLKRKDELNNKLEDIN
ncbi:Myb/SANT-like DNA-binding domain [Popillia japonica]|uniref:Regulatory protein zeste n=1 Tax=Popillia japonica TaxID=7064 RepID=A0AAW1JCB7_POPJA